jgi:uncharacterized coiled-coil DUF342 family protein
MDIGTAKDHIEDLMMQVQNTTAQRDRYMARLFECQQERDRWRKLAERTLLALNECIEAIETIRNEAEKAAGHD